MNKTLYIIKREFWSRLKKRSFIVMTILGPVLFALLLALPGWLITLEDKDEKVIAVIDSSHSFIGKLPETQHIRFEYLSGVSIESIRENFDESGYYAVLFISHIVHYSPDAIQLMSYKQPSLGVTIHISNAIEKEIERQKLAYYKIDNIENILQSIKTNVNIRTIRWSKDGYDRTTASDIAMVVSYFSGLLIYMFIFMFGTLVMRGVMEEKTSRIVEIIVSSVDSFQLMMGKIIGIALVGLTQFAFWIILTLIFSGIANAWIGVDVQSLVQDTPTTNVFDGSTLPGNTNPDSELGINMKDMFTTLAHINVGAMLFSFIVLFLLGYLLYASMFAAIGSLVDIDTDPQQFMFPVTIPLIGAIFLMIHAIQNPDSALSFWASIFPLTSPVVMMARVPYGVPWTDFLLCITLLIAAFLGMVFLSAHVYKKGILMYGQKASWKTVIGFFKS